MDERLTVEELNDIWPVLSPPERVEAFQDLTRRFSED